MTQGGLPEALVRALLWVGMAARRRRRARLRGDHPPARRPRGEPPDDARRLQGAGPRAVPDAPRSTRRPRSRAIPALLPDAIEERRAAFAVLRGIIEASGAPGDAPAARLQRVAALFGLGPELVTLAPSEASGTEGVLTVTAETADSKYERLIAAARDGTPAVTIVAHPCDETSLRGAIDAAAAGTDRAGARRPGGEDPRRRRRARHRHRRPRDRRRAAQPRRRRAGGGADPRGQGRAADEGQPAHRRADEGGRRLRHRPAHRAAHQPRLRHGRARPPGDAVHHRRGDQHLPDLDDQARHRPERHRPLDRHRHGHAARRDPLRRRDGDDEDPLDDRGRRALQDGRARPDHRRPARRPARLRQRHRPRGGARSRASPARSRATAKSSSSPTSRPATCWRRT